VELIKLKVGDRFTMMLVDSLDGKPDEGYHIPNRTGTLLDKYEYAASGRVFKKFTQKDKTVEKTVVIASFGGLLMKLEADARSLKDIELDAHLYALIRKAAQAK
jgi:DNA-directed RNA polymerase I, II, and III subunit RPABC3